MNNKEILKKYKSKTWSTKLKILRQIEGLSQLEAAKKCDSNQKAFWNWEKGYVYPTVKNRKKIADAFNVNITDLFDLEV